MAYTVYKNYVISKFVIILRSEYLMKGKEITNHCLSKTNEIANLWFKMERGYAKKNKGSSITVMALMK